MSDTAEQKTSVLTTGGIAARHAGRTVKLVPVGPSTAGQFNRVREELTPVACVQLNDVRFEFDSSFVGPQVSEEMKVLAELRREQPGMPISVFGHADPVGDDDYNKNLSGRRASAIYALLTRRVELWEELYTNSFGGDRWGVKALQVMLATLGHYQGPIDDVLGQQTRRAVKDFQEGPLGSGLAVDAEPGKQTRHRLFLNYMDAICVDENNQPFRLELTEFLGGGIDSGGKGDYQGCGEFNPILMVSREENESFKTASGKSRRNSENQPNRRVVIFFFRPGLRMRPEHWPCPRASEGTAGCRQRFFSDSDRRRSFQETRREFAINQDTFACRFYHHRIARLSPCEVVLAKNLRVIIHNGFGEPRKRVKAEVIFSDGTTSTAVTDDSGLLVAQTNASHETAHIQYQNFDEDAESVHSGDFFIDVKGVDTDEGVRRRLHNLGYLIGDDLRGALETFQITHGLDTTGEVDPATREKLSAVHDGGDALTPEFDFGERSLGPDELIEEGPTLSQGE